MHNNNIHAFARITAANLIFFMTNIFPRYKPAIKPQTAARFVTRQLFTSSEMDAILCLHSSGKARNMFFETLVIIVHVLVCMALILIILLQATKGAGMGAAFGGASQTVFGSTGRATFLTKVTIVAAVVFSLTSLGLSMMSSGSGSVMDNFSPQETGGPALPELPPPVPEAPMGAGSNQPSDVPETPGTDLMPSAGPSAPADAQPDAAPPLPDGAIAPPEPEAPASDSPGPE